MRKSCPSVIWEYIMNLRFEGESNISPIMFCITLAQRRVFALNLEVHSRPKASTWICRATHVSQTGSYNIGGWRTEHAGSRLSPREAYIQVHRASDNVAEVQIRSAHDGKLCLVCEHSQPRESTIRHLLTGKGLVCPKAHPAQHIAVKTSLLDRLMTNTPQKILFSGLITLE